MSKEQSGRIYIESIHIDADPSEVEKIIEQILMLEKQKVQMIDVVKAEKTLAKQLEEK